MTTLEQIECRGCGETFHKPTMPPFKIGEIGSFDFEQTCPHCGEKNVDTVTVDVQDIIFDESVYKPPESSFLRDAMKRAAATMRQRMDSALEDVALQRRCMHGVLLYGNVCIDCKRASGAKENSRERKQLK